MSVNDFSNKLHFSKDVRAEETWAFGHAAARRMMPPVGVLRRRDDLCKYFPGVASSILRSSPVQHGIRLSVGGGEHPKTRQGSRPGTRHTYWRMVEPKGNTQGGPGNVMPMVP